MDEKKKIDIKTWVLVGCAVVALVIVIAVILAFNQSEKIDSSYFKDSDGKIVVTLDKEMAALDDSIYEGDVVHTVYYYDGDKITNARLFYEYYSEDDAKKAYEKLEPNAYLEDKKLNGKFIMFKVNKVLYEDTTVTELKETIEQLEEIDALILDYDENYVETHGAHIKDEDVSGDVVEEAEVVEAESNTSSDDGEE